MSEVYTKLPDTRGNLELQQAVLTVLHDLFRSGQLAYGYDFSNVGLPWYDVTAMGRETLERASRDPANPDGYNKYLSESCALNPVAESYVSEALKAYNSDCHKASAVLIGAAAESLILEFRDHVKSRLEHLEHDVPRELDDHRIKRVFDQLTSLLDNRKSTMDVRLKESYESFWKSSYGQLCITRNDAGHPKTIDPVSPQTAHSSLLIFPGFAKLMYELKSWSSTEMK